MAAHEGLMLDALNPPAPDQLVRDMEELGAAGIGMYVFRRNANGIDMGVGTWTAAHVDAVQRSGRFVLPIHVPGNNPQPGDPGTVLMRIRAFGVALPVVAIDIETNSFPSHAWVSGAIKEYHAASYRVWRYGDRTPLQDYPAADDDWISHGYLLVYSNRVSPRPALPGGLAADQYSVGVLHNGHEYDASVVNLDLVQIGDDMFTDADRALLQQTSKFAEPTYNILVFGTDQGDNAQTFLHQMLQGMQGRIEDAVKLMESADEALAELKSAMSADGNPVAGLAILRIESALKQAATIIGSSLDAT
jgi:hypothetical protein